MTVNVPLTGTSIPPHDPSHPLTTVQIAGIALGSVLGALLLGVFLWLIRRGTFGSGTLFGFRYGNARRAGWRPDLGTGNAGAEMSQTGNGVASTGNLISPFGEFPFTSPPPGCSPSLSSLSPRCRCRNEHTALFISILHTLYLRRLTPLHPASEATSHVFRRITSARAAPSSA